MGATYLDGLLKALELARSYGGYGLDPQTNAVIRSICADIELEIARHHRKSVSILRE